MLPKYNNEFWVGQVTPANPSPHTATVPSLDELRIRIKYTPDELEEMFKETPKPEQPKEALRFDQGKTNWSLMPFEAVEEINKVLEFGAKKYAEWNFTKNGGMNHSRILNSCLRHLFSYMRGEDLDRESGLSHLAHAGCNILFLLYYKKYPEVFTKDDRHVR